MAGRRQGKGHDGGPKPTRKQVRSTFFRKRLEAAKTANQQLAAAFDYYRSVASHCPDQAVLMNQMASVLATEAQHLEARYDRH
jgi:hypothetical protein